jgi:hypothetical protein
MIVFDTQLFKTDLLGLNHADDHHVINSFHSVFTPLIICSIKLNV